MGCKHCRANNKKIDYEILNTDEKGDQDLFKKCKKIEEDNTKNTLLNIPDYFKLLKVKKIYLGFKSSYNQFKKYKKEALKRGYEKKDFVHPSIYACYNGDSGYFIDYQPYSSDAKNVNYIYKYNKGGLRYGDKNFLDFVESNNLCIIKLKINEKNEKTFYQFFTECCCDGNSWTTISFDFEYNNCCDFVIKALEILDASLETGNLEDDVSITDGKIKNKYESKENVISNKILNFLKNNGDKILY